MCRISLTHIRTNSDCVTKFLSSKFMSFFRPKSEFIVVFTNCDRVFILWSPVRRLTRSVVLLYGKRISRILAANFFLTGTPTIVETRSAYRAHFIVDTNNFHSEAVAAKDGSSGSMSPLLLFEMSLPKYKLRVFFVY